jgi:uncharacterized protein (DUF58 family)
MWVKSISIDPVSSEEVKVHFTSAGLFYVFSGFFLIVFGVLLDLLFLIIPGIVILLSFLYVVGKFYLQKNEMIELEISLPSDVSKAQQFLTLHVQNKSKYKILVTMELFISNGLIAVLKPRKSFLSKANQGTTFILYTPRRGKELIKGISIQFLGIPGLFYVESYHSLEKKIIVLPQPQRVSLPWTLKQRIFDQFLSEITVSRKGRGDEFLSLRDYQFGDEIKHIHWKATARLGKLISKEFEEPIMLRFLLIIDKSLMMSGPKYEFALSAILELVSVIRQSNHSVNVLIHGDKTSWLYNVGTSASSYNQLAYKLHAIEPEGPNFNYRSLSDFIQYKQLSDSVMIILSDLEQDPRVIREGIEMLKLSYQRLLFFACFTPGFGTMAYQQFIAREVYAQKDYNYRKHIIEPKLNRVYQSRIENYSSIINGIRSKFHVIGGYNTNILLELQQTLENMKGKIDKKLKVKL